MDRIIKITLGLFLIILVVFVTIGSYSLITGYAYRSSLLSTYTYSCSVTADTPLTNVTLFLPLPVDPSGNSPVVEKIGKYEISGIPVDWNLDLYGNGPATFLKITTAGIGDPSGTPAGPANVTFSVKVKSPYLIDTANPLANDLVFRPVENTYQAECPVIPNATYTPSCTGYTTTLYAQYDTSPSGTVTIHADLDAVNTWSIFHPDFNEYRNSLDAALTGNNSGWVPASAWIESGIGSYDTPSL